MESLMKSFNLNDYTILSEPIYDELSACITLVKDHACLSERVLYRKRIYSSFNHDKFWKLAGTTSSEEELLEEFEKMLVKEFPNEPVKFPLDKELELPPLPKEADSTPKDGDAYELHKDHNVITSSAGGESYKYCKDCKVEVTDTIYINETEHIIGGRFAD